MILEDFVMLGKTIPEPNSDGRVFVCSAGYSAELGSLLRIYPLARYHSPNTWGIYEIPLTRNPKDSRRESWQIRANRAFGVHDYINERFNEVGTVARKDRAALLSKCVVGSIRELNAEKNSLAIIDPEWLKLEFEHNPESPNSPQLSLFDDEEPKIVEGAKRFAYIPRLRFRDQAGDHNLMLREWGCFEFMRKHGDGRRHELSDALYLNRPCSLLVGNMNHFRNAWLVISVLHGLRDKPEPSQQSIFDLAEDEAATA